MENDGGMDKFYKKIIVFSGIAICADLLFVVLFNTVFMLIFVNGESMENTIPDRSIVIAVRYGVDVDGLERYDIVSFTPPDEPGESFIKRLVGLPGETVEVKDGKVYADGVELDDSFVKAARDGSGDGVYEVPEGCFFVLGDNRDNSSDSRFWDNGYVPAGNIRAKAKFIIFPFSHAGTLEYGE